MRQGRRLGWAEAWRWLFDPSPRIVGEEERSSARLLAVLTFVHVLAAIVATAGGVSLRWGLHERQLLAGPLGPVLLIGVSLIAVAYVLVRAGYHRPALAVYITSLMCFPLLAPFVDASAHDVGLLATAIMSMIITATLLSPRWLYLVSGVVVTCAALEVGLAAWPRSDVILGFTLLLVVGSSGLLLAIQRMHHGRLERLRAARLQRSEAALRASQERLDTLLRASRDLVVVLDAKGARQAAFGAVEDVTGHDPRTRGGFAHFEAMPPEDRARLMVEWEEMLRKPGETVRTEWRYQHKDGNYRWHEGLVTNRLGEEGIDGVVVNIRDITDRKAAEQALARSEERYRTLFSTITDAVFLVDRVGRLLEANDSACRMLGYTREELLTMRLAELEPEGSRALMDAIARRATEQGHLVFEAGHRRKDGSTYPVEVAISQTELDRQPVFMAVARDITERAKAEAERRRLQNQLQHAVKMESVGRLAGGVAHDFNNLLTAILGNIDLALLELRAGGDVRESLTEIREAALSAATVTRQLLAFSRKHVIEPQTIDPNELIRRMHKMLERLIGEDVHLRTGLGPGVGMVKADPGLLEQALVNLAVNARDAMPSGGDLIIETSDVANLPAALADGDMAPGRRHVCIAVTDTGTGMTEEVKRHIFEPFFTTKARGKGTGLGLAMTYAVVEQCGGRIDVTSEPGKGATFRIHLPVVAAAVTVVTPPASPAETRLPGGSETILVVEDDQRVRDVSVQALRAGGYHLLVATSGEDALAQAVAHKERIHLLLTDVVMPGMNGRELAQHMVKLHPEARTLFVSGYGEDIIAHQGALDAGIDFLGKPYSAETLVRRVRDLLDRT